MPKMDLIPSYKKFEAEFKVSSKDNEVYKWIFFERDVIKAKRYIKSCLREEYENPVLLKLEEF